MKMDHHCPWINNCCGYQNHASFTLFLLLAPLGCIHASFIFVMTMYTQLYNRVRKYIWMFKALFKVNSGSKGAPTLCNLSFFLSFLTVTVFSSHFVSLLTGYSFWVALLGVRSFFALCFGGWPGQSSFAFFLPVARSQEIFPLCSRTD